jgi:origin recognition complex subunit 2
MTRQSGGLQLASLASVWASLTPNAKKVFLTVVRFQLEHSEAADYAGISFMELYRLCRFAGKANVHI